MLKFLGVSIVLASASIMGFSSAYRLAQRVEFLQQFSRFLQHLESEIRYLACKVQDILEAFHGEDKFQLFLQTCTEALAKGKSLEEAWQKAVQSLPRETGLTAEDLQVLRGFSQQLGASDAEGQLQLCAYTRQAVMRQLANATETKAQKSRLAVMLHVFGGACVCLCLI